MNTYDVVGTVGRNGSGRQRCTRVVVEEKEEGEGKEKWGNTYNARCDVCALCVRVCAACESQTAGVTTQHKGRLRAGRNTHNEPVFACFEMLHPDNRAYTDGCASFPQDRRGIATRNNPQRGRGRGRGRGAMCVRSGTPSPLSPQVEAASSHMKKANCRSRTVHQLSSQATWNSAGRPPQPLL